MSRRNQVPVGALLPGVLGLVAFAAVGCGPGAEAPGGETVGAARARVVGGVVDRTTTGVVGLAIQFAGHQFFGHCSGTLIAPNLVLTARHCVSLLGNSPENQVRCGETIFTTTGTGDMFLASPATVRPARADDPRFYRGADVRVAPGDNDVCGHDIALIILEGVGIPASASEPIVPRIDRTPDPTELFSASGFGLTVPDSQTTDGTRMRADGIEVECVGVDCNAFVDVVRETEWGAAGVQTCPGDSGGPALDAEGRVIGVVSRGGDGCSGTIYGDVASWKDFIVGVALEAAELGGYEAPFWTSGSSTPPPGSEPVQPPPDLLGDSCTGACGEGFACFTESGVPPGICVPTCSQGGEACPAGYACAESFGVCAPEDSAVFDERAEEGCSVSRGRTGPRGAALLFVGLALALLGRRQVRQGRALVRTTT